VASGVGLFWPFLFCPFRVLYARSAWAARERCATEIAAVVARVLAPAVLACVCRPLRSGVLATSSPPSSARSCPIATCASCVTPSCHPVGGITSEHCANGNSLFYRRLQPGPNWTPTCLQTNRLPIYRVPIARNRQAKNLRSRPMGSRRPSVRQL
jgi:hypothetical protein